MGQSLYDFEIVAARIRNKLYHFGTQGHFIAALGGINIAVFDAIGKTLGVPVHNLLGGRARERLACYATTGYFTDDPKIDIEAQLSPLERGTFAGVKIKIGAGIASDIERVRAARAAIGDDTLLMVDYNGNYTVDVALDSHAADRAVQHPLGEEPLPPLRRAAAMRSCARARRSAISAGEAHYGVHDFKRLIDARCTRHRAAAADRRRRLRRDEGGGAAGGDEQPAGVAAVLGQRDRAQRRDPFRRQPAGLAAHRQRRPIPMLVEYDVGDNPLRDLLVHDPIAPANGELPVPLEPGLGLRLNPEIVAHYTV